jgi:hypothetical protein
MQRSYAFNEDIGILSPTMRAYRMMLFTDPQGFPATSVARITRVN